MNLRLGICRGNILAVLAGILLFSCKDNKTSIDKIDFDRKAMLENWADNILMPAYADFETKASDFQSTISSLHKNSSSHSINVLQQQFAALYIAFEKVKAFEVGPAQDISMRSSLNTFPADTSKIMSNLRAGNVDIHTASNITARGFPAMDFLLYTDKDVLNDVDIQNYLKLLSTDVLNMARSVNQQWPSYRSRFVNAGGADMGSSLGQMVNAINKDYELVKNAKIGFPAGKKTLGQPYPETCEAYYSGLSLDLAIANVTAIHNFYRGVHFNETQNGLSLQDYLVALGATTQGEALDKAIDDQFSTAIIAMENIDSSLSDAVVNDVKKVDEAYLAIQRNVVLLKTDMPSAMGVLITYQDNDGD